MKGIIVGVGTKKEEEVRGMAVCSSCNGLGTYEYWGTVYRCPVCGGRGYNDDPEDWEEEWEEELEEELEEEGEEEEHEGA